MRLRPALSWMLLLALALPAAAQDAIVPTEAAVVRLADGTVAIAGVAEPGAQVELLDGERVVGRAEANAEGAWMLVPEGGSLWRVRTTSRDGRFQYLAAVPIGPIDPLPAPIPQVLAATGRVLQRVDSTGAAEFPPLRYVVVRPGESLWSIAADAYGDGWRYTDVAAANAGRVGPGNLIHPGQILFLP